MAADKARPVWTARTVFQSPFSTAWPPIDPSNSSQCLKILSEHYPEEASKRRKRGPGHGSKERKDEKKKGRGGGRGRGDKKGEDKGKGGKDVGGRMKGRREMVKGVRDKGKDVRDKGSGMQGGGEVKDVEMKEGPEVRKNVVVNQKPRGLVFGLNEVTKGVEKGILDVVIVCKDTKPHLLVRHVPVLCYVGKVKLIGLLGGGDDLGAIFGMKKLIGVGLRKGEMCLEKLKGRLEGLNVKLEFPWLDKVDMGKLWKNWKNDRQKKKRDAVNVNESRKRTWEWRWSGRVRRKRPRLVGNMENSAKRRATNEAIALGEAVQASGGIPDCRE